MEEEEEEEEGEEKEGERKWARPSISISQYDPFHCHLVNQDPV